jgi:hypothetical protein
LDGRNGGDIGDTSHNAWVYFTAATQFTGSGGTCVINGSGGCTSDARLKRDIHEIGGADALAQLSKMSGVTYYWADPKLDQKQRVGVLAQSVLKAYPQLVGTVKIKFRGRSGNYYTVDYAGLTAPLISAVNELNRRVNSLKAVGSNANSERVKDARLAPAAAATNPTTLLKRIETLQAANERQASEIRALQTEMAGFRRTLVVRTAQNDRFIAP